MRPRLAVAADVFHDLTVIRSDGRRFYSRLGTAENALRRKSQKFNRYTEYRFLLCYNIIINIIHFAPITNN